MSDITVSAKSVIFAGTDQRQRLRAELRDDDGDRLPDELVKWRSSAPDIVQVSQDGELRALADVGYAVVRATYADAVREIPVMVAKLAPGARILEPHLVRSASGDADKATLVLDDQTGGLQVGDVVVNDAIFGRITQLHHRNRDIHIATEMVPLTYAFVELRIETVTSQELEITASPEGVTVSAPGIDGGSSPLAAAGTSPMFMAALDLPTLPSMWGCEAGVAGQIKDIEVERGDVTWTGTFVYDFFYELNLFAPPTMNIDVSHSVGVTRTSDTFKLKPGIQFGGSCFLEVGPIPSPPIYIPGTPVKITFYATPKVGFEISVTPSWPLEIQGPTVTGNSIVYRAGLAYTGEGWDGYAALDDFTRGTVIPAELDSIEAELETQIGPFVAVSFAMGIGIPGADVKLEFLKPKGHITWKHTVATPLNRFHFAYNGPQWKVISGAKTWLGLKIHSKVLKTAFGYLGIYVGFNAHDFVHFEDEWLRSPSPSVSRQASDLPYSTVLVADISQASAPYVLTELYQGWMVDFIARRLGDATGVSVGSSPLNAAGVATFLWDMLDHPPGDYTVRAQVRNPSWPITQLFPYTSNSSVEVTVVEPRATIVVTRPINDTLTAGNHRFRADYHYPFGPEVDAQIQWHADSVLVATQAIQGINGVTEDVIICLLPPEATVAARIVDTAPNGTVLASHVRSLTVFASAQLPEDATSCGDVDGTELLPFDPAAESLEELLWLLRQFGGPHQLDELGSLPQRRALSTFGTDVTSPLRRSVDLLQMKLSRADAMRTVDALLAQALDRHGLSRQALREPRGRVVERLATRHSEAFLGFVEDLFLAVDARSSASGTTSLREVATQVLSSRNWTDEEGEFVLQLLLLVAVALDYLVPTAADGSDALLRLRFEPATHRRGIRADSLAPVRAAVTARLGILADHPRTEAGAAFEVSQLMGLAAAVRMAHP
jgi:hypothetical protein